MTRHKHTVYNEKDALDRLRTAIHVAGSQWKLGQLWRIHPSYFGHCLNGRRKISERLAKRLGLKVDRTVHHTRCYINDRGNK